MAARNTPERTLPSPTQNVASGLIGSEVNFFYFNRSNLSIQTTLLPALSEPGRVHFNLNAAYYVKLWSKLTWNVSFYGSWDNHRHRVSPAVITAPAPGSPGSSGISKDGYSE